MRPTLASLTIRHFSQFRYVPDLGRVIAASRDQPPVVGAERHAGDEAGVPAEAVDQLAGPAVPDLYGAVLTPRGDPPAVVAERHGGNVPPVPRKGLQHVAGLHVPDLDQVVLTARGQPLTVGAEGHVHTRPGHPRVVEGEARCWLPIQVLLVQAGHVPQLDLSISARRRQVPADAAEHHSSDDLVVGAERADLPAGPRIPDLQDSISIPRDQVSAVGAECHGEAPRAERDLEFLLAGPCVPDPAGEPLAVPAGAGDPLAVGVPGQTEHGHTVVVELDAHFAGRGVPDLHGRADPGRADPGRRDPAVAAHRQPPDFIAVLGEVQSLLALVLLQWGRVPDADGFVRTGGGEAVAVRTERHTPARAVVSAQAEYLPAGGRVPDAHDLLLAGRGEAAAVPAEGDARDASVMRKGVPDLAGRRVPQSHLPVEGGLGQPTAVRAERQRADRMGRCEEGTER